MEVYIEKMMEQLNSGESKTIFKNISCIVIIGLTTSGRKPWQEEEETRKDTSIVLIRQEQFWYFRALQGHSGRSLIDPILQDKCCYSERLLTVLLSCRMCNQFTFHHQFGIDTWRSKATDRVFFLLVDPMDKNHKDPHTIDLNAPRHAQYVHKAWKKHQNTVYWVDINLALKKGLKFYQTRSNATILHETLPAYCIPKVVRMETGEVIYEKVYASPRPPPKISLKHDG